MASQRVLLCSSNPDEAARLARELVAAGFECVAATDERDAPTEDDFDADAWLLEASEGAWAWIEAARRAHAAPATILISSFGTASDAVEALRRGAADYLVRPVSPERLLVALRRALEARALSRENQRLRASLGERFQLGRLISRDPRMAELSRLVESVADTRAHLLITGESGTGKTLLARTIHELSTRAKAPFVEVNCGALPATLLESELFGHAKGAFTGATRDKLGRFEAADGGTIFLDEIATAPLELQVKLLRVIQDRVLERVGENQTRAVDVRVIAATNVDLTSEVRAGRFREDLYWRLAVVPIHLPALRERAKDVPLLAASFLERYASEYRRSARAFTPDAMAALCSASWRGNVRQLENTVERAVLLARGDAIGVDDLGPEFVDRPAALPAAVDAQRDADAPVLPLKLALEAPERELILRALRASGGNRKQAAALLGVNRTTLFNKMRKHRLLGREVFGEPQAPLPGHPGRDAAP